MKRWGELKPQRLDEKEFKTDLGKGNFIFVGSSNDMFANNTPTEWTKRIIEYLKKFDNKYLLQTKNPRNYHKYDLPENFVLGCTIESDRVWYDYMGKTPPPWGRAYEMQKIKNKKFITIEPILDFTVENFLEIIKIVNPDWVNIGADTGNNHLPEPSKEKVDLLINSLKSKVTIKKNMKRINKV
jgi:DNA repair photolyase